MASPECKECPFIKKSNYGGLYCYHTDSLTGDLSKIKITPQWCPLLRANKKGD